MPKFRSYLEKAWLRYSESTKFMFRKPHCRQIAYGIFTAMFSHRAISCITLRIQTHRIFHLKKVDNQFQDFIQRTGGSLIQSEAHTRKDLMGGASFDAIKSATLDHIIPKKFPMMIQPKRPRQRVQRIGKELVKTIMR